MKLSALRLGLPYLKAFSIAFIIGNLLLVAAYSFHSSALERNALQGHAFLEKKEGLYLNLFPDVSENRIKSRAFALETFIDRGMLARMVPQKKDLSPWRTALYMNNYPRYWHGYAVILRPLMTIFNYSQLRLLNVFLITVLTLATAWLLARHINIQAALSFILAVSCVKIFIIPLSITLCTMFYVFFIFFFMMLAFAIRMREPLLDSPFFPLFIFILGMVTAFIDLLTIPLLPVGLLIAIACIWDYEKYHILSVLKILRLFLIWGLGYVGLWASKWILATIFLDKNVISDALSGVITRIALDPPWGEHIDSFTALKRVLWCVISPLDMFWVFMVIVFLGLGTLFMILEGTLAINKDFYKGCKLFFPLSVVGLTPFMWTMSIANHSQIHFFFTYRIFCISIFAILYILLKALVFPKISFQMNIMARE